MKFQNIFKRSNDREIAKQLRAATKISMSDSSHERMRGFLSEYTRSRPIRAAHPAATSNWFSIFLTSRIHPMPIIAAALIIVVSSGTVAASETALPGDLLYPIKVHITEEVRATLAVTPKAQADWAVERAERRLEEAAILTFAGELDDEIRTEIDLNLDAHMKSAGKNREQLESENDLPDASEVETNIGAISIARANILGERPVLLAAKVAARTALSEATSFSMTAAEILQESLEAATTQNVERPEVLSRGNRAAAKARIEATKKFLSRNNKRLKPEASAQIQEQLKAASVALSVGEESVKRGNESEAFDNFSKALQTAIETQDFVSEHLDSDESSQSDTRRGEKSNDSNESEDSSGKDENDSGESSEYDD